MGIQLDLLHLIAGPNPAEQHLELPPGIVPPLVNHPSGSIYHVADVCGKDRYLVLVAKAIHIKGKDTVPTRWVWTNEFSIAEQLIAPSL
jgi:hypothetical protein